MNNLFERGLLLGLGAINMTREKAEQAVEELVQRGEIQREEGRQLVKELLERGRTQQRDLQAAIQEELEKVLRQSQIATKEELGLLENRITVLEEKLKEKEN